MFRCVVFEHPNPPSHDNPAFFIPSKARIGNTFVVTEIDPTLALTLARQTGREYRREILVVIDNQILDNEAVFRLWTGDMPVYRDVGDNERACHAHKR